MLANTMKFVPFPAFSMERTSYKETLKGTVLLSKEFIQNFHKEEGNR